MLGLLKRNKPPVLIVNIDGSHLYDCSQIHAASFAHGWSDGALDEMLSAKGTGGLVAVQEVKSGKQNVLGFVIFRQAASECEIITIATASQSRKKGVGKALIENLIRHCLTERIAEIFLEVDEANEPAIGLYRRYGFAEVGKRKAYYAPPPAANSPSQSAKALKAQDAVIMRLDLLA